jgi:hypothetical protein
MRVFGAAAAVAQASSLRQPLSARKRHSERFKLRRMNAWSYRYANLPAGVAKFSCAANAVVCVHNDHPEVGTATAARDERFAKYSHHFLGHHDGKLARSRVSDYTRRLGWLRSLCAIEFRTSFEMQEGFRDIVYRIEENGFTG